MAGLGVLLEPKQQQQQQHLSNKSPQILNKVTSLRPPNPNPNHHHLPTMPPLSPFLEHCFLCHQPLSHSKDIYMYRGDRAFCSEECRCRQIYMDEETVVRESCGAAAAAAGGGRRGKAAGGKRGGGFGW